MVYQDVLVSSSPKGIRSVGFIFRQFVRAHAETDEADYYVIGFDRYRMSFQADAVARGGLSGNGYIPVLDFKFFA